MPSFEQMPGEKAKRPRHQSHVGNPKALRTHVVRRLGQRPYIGLSGCFEPWKKSGRDSCLYVKLQFYLKRMPACSPGGRLFSGRCMHP